MATPNISDLWTLIVLGGYFLAWGYALYQLIPKFRPIIAFPTLVCGIFIPLIAGYINHIISIKADQTLEYFVLFLKVWVPLPFLMSLMAFFLKFRER